MADFLLRIAWIVTVTVGEGGLIHGEVLKSIMASLEVFRYELSTHPTNKPRSVFFTLKLIYFFSRFMWNFFRLENEHLNNCGQFRAVRDISIAPVIDNDLDALMSLMDEDVDSTQRKMWQRKKHTRSDYRDLGFTSGL